MFLFCYFLKFSGSFHLSETLSNWIQDVLGDKENCKYMYKYLLTQNGYMEFKKHQKNKSVTQWKCRYLKARLDLVLTTAIIEYLIYKQVTDLIVINKQYTYYICIFLFWLLCQKQNQTVLYDISQVLYYLLLIGGIETNPGPPKNNEPLKKG